MIGRLKNAGVAVILLAHQGAALFLLTNCRRVRPDSTPKIAHTYLPCQSQRAYLRRKGHWPRDHMDERAEGAARLRPSAEFDAFQSCDQSVRSTAWPRETLDLEMVIAAGFGKADLRPRLEWLFS